MIEIIIKCSDDVRGSKNIYGEPLQEIVRCKDCDNRHTDDCPMYHEEWYEIDEGDGYVDNDFTIHDYSQDNDFCSWAKMKGGAE